MQRCLHCGQLNDDYDDSCAYCGEPLYIEVDHNSNHSSRDIKMDHLYADSIARELIDENTLFEDDLEEVTRELLGENNDNNTFTIDNEEYYFDQSEENDDIKNEELTILENEIKRKIRRNKKLEIGMGLMLRNIDVILEDYVGPLEIMGEITTNDKLENKIVQLSVISYDNNKNQLNKQETMVKVDHGNYVPFTISLDKININETAIIIILPEMIRYNKDYEEIEEVVPEKEEITVQGNNIFIEQLTDIERKIGMNITNTSIIVKSNNEIEIVGEIRLNNADKYHNIKIAATCYNPENKIIGTQSTLINTKLFLGFDTLSIKIKDITVDEIERIRLYPTLQ